MVGHQNNSLYPLAWSAHERHHTIHDNKYIFSYMCLDQWFARWPQKPTTKTYVNGFVLNLAASSRITTKRSYFAVVDLCRSKSGVSMWRWIMYHRNWPYSHFGTRMRPICVIFICSSSCYEVGQQESQNNHWKCIDVKMEVNCINSIYSISLY